MTRPSVAAAAGESRQAGTSDVGRRPAAAGAQRPAAGRHSRRAGVAVLAALLLAGVVAVGACGGGTNEAERAPTGATATTADPATAAAGAATAAGGASTPVPVKAGPTTTTTATTRPASTTTTTAAPAAPRLNFAPAGTYRYTSTGRFTTALTGIQERNGEATITIDPPSGADQRSVRQGLGRSTEQVLRLDGANALLVSLHLTDQGIDKEVRPSPPALALPGDAAPGRTWSWRAMSTDGRTTVDSSFNVARTEDITVGGERVSALVIEAVLALSGDIVSTSRQTLWVSPQRRLVLRQDETTDGRLGLVAFSTTSSETLLSLTPG